MKRSGPWPRKKGMNRGVLNRQSDISRNTAAKWKTSLSSKPARRTPEETRARNLVRIRSGGICEIRVVCDGAPATNWHHRQNEGQGGTWDAANGLDACGSGTTGCHGYVTEHPQIAKSPAHGWSVSAYANPADVPALIAGHGLVYLLPDGSVRPADQPDDYERNAA